MSVNKNTNGSIMIAALIVTLITGSLVGFFLKTVTQESRNAYRSNMAFQAVNLAEAGLEFAIYSVRSNDWAGWTKSGSAYYRESFPYIGYTFRGESRFARVYVRPDDSPPRAVAEGVIQSSDGSMSITRQIYIELGNRSLFANGLVAKEAVIFNGNGIAIDSYHSSKGVYNTTLNRNDNGTVASISVSADTINLGNADVWGRVATGGDPTNPNPPRVGPQGSIRGMNTPDGVKIDPTRIALDFWADFPDPSSPTLVSPDTSITGTTLGSTGSTSYYKLSDLTVAMKDGLTILGDVVILVEGDVKIQGTVELDNNASLELSFTGDFDLSGSSSAFINPGIPENLMVSGIGTDPTQEMKLAGNGSFTGVVYAPNYDLELGGSGTSGEMFGAVVANNITFGGGYQFHYDEDLADLKNETAKKVTRWVELTDAGERKNMTTILKDGL